MMKRLLIIGSGEKEDIDIQADHDIMVINLEIYNYPYAEHFVSVHNPLKTKDTLNDDIQYHVCRYFQDNINARYWDWHNPGGTSGLFALHVGIHLGYDKVALYGVPLSNEYGTRIILHAWYEYIRKNKEACKKARSYSGKTLKLLGKAEGWFDA